MHALGELHAPLAVQVWTPLPEHCVWPGAHEPVQAPPTQVWFEQAAPEVQVPVELHVCGWLLPEQLTSPGPHVPEHAPPRQVWWLHATAVPQVPFDAHVCTPLPEHCVAPGVHTPVQAPLAHTYWHVLAVP